MFTLIVKKNLAIMVIEELTMCDVTITIVRKGAFVVIALKVNNKKDLRFVTKQIRSFDDQFDGCDVFESIDMQ